MNQNIGSEDVKDKIIKQYIEFLSASLEDENIDLNDLVNDLEYYFDHPLHINYASYDELKKLIFLNDFDIANILLHREKYGDFLSIYELQSIEGLDVQTIRLMSPFITTELSNTLNKKFIKRLVNNHNHEIYLQSNTILEKSKGYIKDENNYSYYIGDPRRYSFRYKFRSDHIRASLNAEKDPGEEFFRGSQKNGFDFYSGHIYYENTGFIKKVVVGDYHIEFGQGLSIWTSRAFSKTQDIYLVKRNARGIAPYASLMESNFLRGTSVLLGSKKLQTTLFYSSRKLDASNDTLIDDDDIFFTSLNNSGYHRTIGEIKKKNTLEEQIVGIIPSLHLKKLNLSAAIINRQRGADFRKDIQLYNQYSLDTLKVSTQLGLNYDYMYKNLLFFGEISKNLEGSMGFINGAMISLGKSMSVSAVYRNYSREFLGIYSNPFRESYISNERGLYIGMDVTINKFLKLNIYSDHFYNSWLTYYVSSPNRGTDHFVQLNYIPQKRALLYLRFKAEQKNKDLNTGTYPEISNYDRYFIRFHYEMELNKKLSSETRIEYNKTLQYNNFEYGYLIYQDIHYSSRFFKVSGRLALFDTDSYTSRIYAFENNLKYIFYIPAYYDKGWRWYLLFDWKTKAKLNFQAKIAQSIFLNKNTISSGYDEIMGNKKTDVGISMNYFFR